jgi:hypothetical protein
VEPAQLDAAHLETAFIYCAVFSLGLDKINSTAYRSYGQKAYDLIISMMSRGCIDNLDNENSKVLIMDLLIKSAYTQIKRGESWKARYLYFQARNIAQITDPTKLIEEDKEESLSLKPDLPSFLKLHLATFGVWATKSTSERCHRIRAMVNESSLNFDRVQLGTLVMTGFLLACESEDVFSALMKTTFVPIEPQYREALASYLSKISENISGATPDQQLTFYLSLALLKIRDYAGSPIFFELESAFANLLRVQNPDTNTLWLCGIGVSLSLLSGSQLLHQFTSHHSYLNNIHSWEWNKKYELDDKILSATFNLIHEEPFI